MSNEAQNPSTPSLVDRAAQSADRAIHSTQVAANHALDGMSSTVHGLQADAANYTQRGVEAVRHGTQSLREGAQRASESTVGYIKEEPVKAMLMAAATGAALMALVGVLSRSRS